MRRRFIYTSALDHLLLLRPHSLSTQRASASNPLPNTFLMERMPTWSDEPDIVHSRLQTNAARLNPIIRHHHSHNSRGVADGYNRIGATKEWGIGETGMCDGYKDHDHDTDVEQSKDEFKSRHESQAAQRPPRIPLHIVSIFGAGVWPIPNRMKYGQENEQGPRDTKEQKH